MNQEYVVELPNGYRIEETHLNGYTIYNVYASSDKSIIQIKSCNSYSEAVTVAFNHQITCLQAYLFTGITMFCLGSWISQSPLPFIDGIVISLLSWWGAGLLVYTLCFSMSIFGYSQMLTNELKKLDSKSLEMNPQRPMPVVRVQQEISLPGKSRNNKPPQIKPKKKSIWW